MKAVWRGVTLRLFWQQGESAERLGTVLAAFLDQVEGEAAGVVVVGTSRRTTAARGTLF
jgi:hypothetical protein